MDPDLHRDDGVGSYVGLNFYYFLSKPKFIL
jgi:hypothetical protein